MPCKREDGISRHGPAAVIGDKAFVSPLECSGKGKAEDEPEVRRPACRTDVASSMAKMTGV